jgi:YgiT-type zinc finger domain-containing protein
MASDEMGERWRARYEQLTGEMVEWRREHPRATFNEIEDELDKRLNCLRAEMAADIAEAADGGVAEEPVCPTCGRRARLRGKKRRRLRTQGGEEVELERHHAICPHCGWAFFPPG